MIEGFKNPIAEERKKNASAARIAAMLHYVERTPDAMEMMRIELAEAAKATNRGKRTILVKIRPPTEADGGRSLVVGQQVIVPKNVEHRPNELSLIVVTDLVVPHWLSSPIRS